tara:strand:- start:1875 stop:2015 length:141 start_codon:yes stop_codon:yes gene_type:complete
LKLSDNTINELEAPNILKAGFSTGHQSIEKVSRFKEYNVLAVHLNY